jgi:riboflavin synthase
MVFTGIVEEMGEVLAVERKAELVMWDGSKSEGFVLRIKCTVCLEAAYIGCSIAVNGTCLTATALDKAWFEVNCAQETLRKTDLGDLEVGSFVNLERSMAASARNSGHFVQGHVDEAGKILEFKREGDSLWVKISLSDSILPYVVPKGYIAVDGTSLTVCEVNQREKWFNLMLIAHTQQCIVIPKKKVGDRVNLEADCLGKYAAAAVVGVADRVRHLEGQVVRANLTAGAALAAATAVLIYLARKT